MNRFLNGLTNATNYDLTENGALAHKSTGSAVYDLFSLGGAYRKRSDDDVVFLFTKAFAEDPKYALKCLFYLRDVRGGQGERRFFRLCMRWLAIRNREVAKRNLKYISEYGRWDDLYTFVGTPLEVAAFDIIKEQLALDMTCKTPSLLAKWLKSENTSSAESCRLGKITRQALGMSHKQYRKTLSILRKKINIVERLMSANQWDLIEFDKIPSKAGLIYKNAFARRDIIKAKYETFIKDENTKVNAKTLYPYEVVAEALKCFRTVWYGLPAIDNVNRMAVNKYWDNLTDYFADKTFNGLAVIDTSGSMTGSSADAPINIAISLGLYCAERANGPFANHYISFASRPQLISTNGVDFVDKVYRIYKTNLVDNTNLLATFDLILKTAISNNCSQEDLPENLIIISDMQIDCGKTYTGKSMQTEMETVHKMFERAGYKTPHLIYWNVNASKDTILDGTDGVTYVSGCSPVIFEQILTGKRGIDLMYDKLNSERYAPIS